MKRASRIFLNIKVPTGVQPGQVLAVRVPDGRELTVVVPRNAGQACPLCSFLESLLLLDEVLDRLETSQELQLEYDVNAGHLKVATESGEPTSPLFGWRQGCSAEAQMKSYRSRCHRASKPGRWLLDTFTLRGS